MISQNVVRRAVPVVRMLLLSSLCACTWAVSQAHAQDQLGPAVVTDPCQALGESDLFKPLGDIRLQVESDGKRLPPDCSAAYFSRPNGWSKRTVGPKVYHWEPTNFFHMPAYFDDVPLERYGQTKHHPYLQPAVSAARFFTQVPALPYKMGLQRPHECVSTLGHRPPGSCVPCIKQTLPWQTDAALLEGATAVGLILLLP